MDASKRDGIMLPIRRTMYANKQPSPFLRRTGREFVSPGTSSSEDTPPNSDYLKLIPQKRGQINDVSSSPFNFGE